MKVAITWAALAALVTAAPTPATHNQALGTRQVAGAAAKNSSLPAIAWIDGNRVNFNSPTASGQVCTAEDDVLTCAGKIAQGWHINGNATSAQGHMTVQAACLKEDSTDTPCTVDFGYHVEFSDCKISDPVIVSHDDAFFCNSGNGCKQSFQFGHSTTTTNSDGYRVGSQLKASASIGIVSTELTVSGDFNQNWSNSSTATTTVTREYDMQDGQVCAPTTIQFSAQCQTKVTFDQGGDLALVTTEDGVFQQEMHVCGFTSGGYVTMALGDSMQAICQSLNPQGVSMDVSTIGGAAAWAIQGCMFQ